MIIKKKDYTSIETSDTEKMNIDMTYCVLSGVYKTLGGDVQDVILVNPVNGELIELSEIPRILGVLSAIRENTIWEVQK